MSYQKRAKLESWLVEKLDNLESGCELTLEIDERALSALRHQIYAWMHEQGVKPYYKLSVLSPTRIRVTRKVSVNPRLVEDVSPIDQKVINFVSRHLVDIHDEDEAIRLIKENIQKDQWPYVLDQWIKKIKDTRKNENCTI